MLLVILFQKWSRNFAGSSIYSKKNVIPSSLTSSKRCVCVKEEGECVEEEGGYWKEDS